MTGSDLVAYMARFSHLAALSPAMVNPKPKKVERYISIALIKDGCTCIANI